MLRTKVVVEVRRASHRDGVVPALQGLLTHVLVRVRVIVSVMVMVRSSVRSSIRVGLSFRVGVRDRVALAL